MEKRLAVIFPGVGYHVDKPLLYYSRKLAKEYGYEVAVQITVHFLPESRAMHRKCIRHMSRPLQM